MVLLEGVIEEIDHLGNLVVSFQVKRKYLKKKKFHIYFKSFTFFHTDGFFLHSFRIGKSSLLIY